MSSEQHHVESGDENELRRLRHELELTRKELAAAVELHERAGTMIAEALGRHALTHQVGWLYEDYAADIRHLVEQGDRLAVVQARLAAVQHVPGEMCPTYLAAKGEWEAETTKLRAALVTALADTKAGIESNERAVAHIASVERDLTLAQDALATVHDDLLTHVRGGPADLGGTATTVDVAIQHIFNSRAMRARNGKMP